MAAIIKLIEKFFLMSLSQIELVWVIVRMEWECFWLNLREDNKMSEQGVWIQDGSVWIQHGRDQDGCHHQVESEWMSEECFCAEKMAQSMMEEIKMAAIIKLSQNEWVKFFLCKMVESKMAEFKMAAIIKLSEN